MSMSNFVLAYFLTGCIFVFRIMGTHNNYDTELHLWGRTWTFTNFKQQFPKNILSISLIILAIWIWFFTFMFMITNRPDKT